MRRSSLPTIFFATVMASQAPSLARAQDAACITPAARALVDACPSAAVAPTATHDEHAASHLAVAHRRSDAEPPHVQATPGVDLDPRDAMAAPHVEGRRRELLEAEIRTLERILERPGSTSATAEYVARLADTYVELGADFTTRARTLDQEIFEAEHASPARDVASLRAEQRDAETHASAARDSAIRAYARLVSEFPDHPTLDQVLFSLAYALGEGHHFEQARQVYLRLVRDFPASRFVPHAWLSFAEYYFEQSDMPAARTFYERVLETPVESNPVYGYARYKLAWTAYNQEDFQGALTEFARVLELVAQHPELRDGAALARQVRRELVLPYSRVGRPSQALAFFRRYAADAAQALEMLESLGELYEDTGQWPEAIQVYHQLMSEAPASDALCHWQSRVTSAVISSRPKADQVTEAHRLVDVMNTFARGSHPAEQVASCRQTTATILVELATAWHREAIGDGTQPGTNDRTTMRQASELYDLVTAELPDMAELEYPEIDRRDWPTLYRVSYFRAELLWRMEDYRHCGPAFDRVVELDASGPYTPDAAYGAVLCYERVYQDDYAPRERERVTASATPRARVRGRHRGAPAPDADAPPEPPRALTEVETGMVQAFARYLCTVPESDERATVQYRLARVYYEARHFEEASVAFRAVALEHPESELGPIAANLHLDALNALYRREGRASCVTVLREDVEPLDHLYCATPEAADAHADLCPILVGLRCDVLRLEAEALARAGDHTHAAPRYVAIARDHVACGRRDEMLWNAAIEYEAAHLVGRAIQVRQALVEGFPASPLAHRAIYLLGASYHALAIYASAADWYERFAREHPEADESTCTDTERAAGTCAIAHLALENAVFFRVGLGDTERAIADATLYEQSYRRGRPRETADVVFSLGAIYERARDWAGVVTYDRAFLRDYGRVARADQVLQANVRIARAQLALDRADQAEPYLRAALSAWVHGGAEAIAATPGTDAEHALWLAHAREAVSEAEYDLAEERFAAFTAIHFPRYAGQRTLSSVMRWSSRELGPWLTRRFAALHDAEQAYDQIAALGVPEWEIAAATRVGEMYRRIVDDVRSAPVPEEIEDDDELYGIYVGTLERILNGSTAGADQQWDTADDVMCTPESSEPSCTGAPLRQATEHFRYCLTLATRVRWFDDHSAQCERELNAMDAAAYPMAAELRGTASYGHEAPTPPRAVDVEDETEGSEGSAPDGPAA